MLLRYIGGHLWSAFTQSQSAKRIWTRKGETQGPGLGFQKHKGEHIPFFFNGPPNIMFSFEKGEWLHVKITRVFTVIANVSRQKCNWFNEELWTRYLQSLKGSAWKLRNSRACDEALDVFLALFFFSLAWWCKKRVSVAHHHLQIFMASRWGKKSFRQKQDSKNACFRIRDMQNYGGTKKKKKLDLLFWYQLSQPFIWNMHF